MQTYRPQKIYIERKALDFPLAQRVLAKLSGVPCEIIEDWRPQKIPAPITGAKKTLAIALQRGRGVKPFPKIPGALNLGDYVFNPQSNCHLECTYCILQSYLANNPSITLFANLDLFFEEIKQMVATDPERIFRFGTGELSDSLALDPLTEMTRELVPFFASQKNAFLELKTKSNHIDRLLQMDPRGRTVVSWSLAPQRIIRAEELKCASLRERLEAAASVQRAGYPVGIHLDPMIYFSQWRQAYDELLSEIKKHLDPHRLAWISMGTLRFDKNLKQIASKRFPQTQIFSEDLLQGPDGKIRYFKPLREELYRHLWEKLEKWTFETPRYLCMEPDWMWKRVTGIEAPDPTVLEQILQNRLQALG